MGNIRVVSERSEAEIKRQRATDALDGPLRQLASNILRIVRGAGKPYDLYEQMLAVLQAMNDYRDAVGAWPSSFEMDKILNARVERNWSDEDLKRWTEGGTLEMELAFDAICRGALQNVASKLVDQKLQIAAGENEVYEAVYRIEALREGWRKERARQAQQARAPARKKARRRKSESSIVL